MRQNYKSSFQEDSYYHVYNRANGREQLFLNSNHYDFFLKQYQYFVSSWVDTYAYCLMPNHYHFLVRVKSEHELEKLQSSDVFKASDDRLAKRSVSEMVSESFRRLFMSYTKSFNKQTYRTGSLFTPRFNRKKITSEIYLKNVINYIHLNPVAHHQVQNLEDWKYSSYSVFLSQQNTNVKREAVLELFGDKANFLAYHDIQKARYFAKEMNIYY